MKKAILFFMMISLVFILNFEKANACSCTDFDVDRYLNQDDRFLIYGTVYKEISNRKIIFEVKENYSKDLINQYIIIQTETTVGPACGINFNGYKGNELLVRGGFDQGKTVMNLKSCSITGVSDGNIRHIMLNDELHDSKTLTELNEYVRSVYDDQAYGEINHNSVDQIMTKAMLSTMLPYVGGIAVLGVVTVIIVKMKRNKNKSSSLRDS